MLTDKEIAIYALGKTEGVHSIAETLGKGLDDEKYIESWNKTMKLLGIEMPLKDLEKIYNEFAKKMEELVEKSKKEEIAGKITDDNVEEEEHVDGIEVIYRTVRFRSTHNLPSADDEAEAKLKLMNASASSEGTSDTCPCPSTTVDMSCESPEPNTRFEAFGGLQDQEDAESDNEVVEEFWQPTV